MEKNVTDRMHKGLEEREKRDQKNQLIASIHSQSLSTFEQNAQLLPTNLIPIFSGLNEIKARILTHRDMLIYQCKHAEMRNPKITPTMEAV